jgi:hypothetical protein
LKNKKKRKIMTNNPIAVDIYERIEMNKNGEGGSVWEDLYGDEEHLPTLADFEDYFGDLDPTAFL